MLSVVIPAYNEADNVRPTCLEVLAAAGAAGLDCEVIVVDDGSGADTWRAIGALCAEQPAIAAVRLRKNFGKAAALAAGVDAAAGDVIVTLDADGQDDPQEIARLVEALDGHDVVVGWKRERHDPWLRVVASRCWNALVSALTGVRLHDHNCGLKVLRREVLTEIPLYGDLHRYLAVLAAQRGFRVRELPVRHRPRRSGRSKYGPTRYLTGLLDLFLVRLMTAFEGRPQHLLGAVGALVFAAGAGALAYLGVTWLAQFTDPKHYQPIAERPLTFYALAAFLFGTQTMLIAYVAGLVVHGQAQRRRPYSVRERIPRGAPAAAALPPPPPPSPPQQEQQPAPPAQQPAPSAAGPRALER